MSSISLNGDTSGSILIQAPAIAGSGTLTLPTGTATLATDGPAFSVTRSSAQSVASSTWTKVQFTSELFDTANCFDTSTNYRFTPTVAGYYQTNWSLVCDALTSTTEYIVAIYKNGSNYSWGTNLTPTSAHYNAASGSDLVYLNGSTDYIELYVYQDSGSSKNIFPNNTSYPSRFSASLARGA